MVESAPVSYTHLDVYKRQAQRRIDAGATVAFGSLGMNATGLVHKGRQIPWTTIDTIRTQSDSEGMETDETLIIVAQGKTHKVDRSRIDNEPVMLALSLIHI